MDFNIERNRYSIKIVYPENDETYEYLIKKDDTYVENFWDGNLDEMEKILKNSKIIKKDSWYILSINNKIIWNYILNKTENNT